MTSVPGRRSLIVLLQWLSTATTTTRPSKAKAVQTLEMILTDLPEDILHIFADFLPPSDLLSFCATTRDLHDHPTIRFSPSYWRRITRNTFRVPNQPVAEHDGRRWMQLYRRMRTQTKVYTWGHNDRGSLGGEIHVSAGLPVGYHPRAGNRIGVRGRLWPPSRSWPDVTSLVEIGVIADLQCGGWSTTVLSSKGQLYSVGEIDGIPDYQARGLGSTVPYPLDYPPGFVNPAERYEAHTAIKQFSSGRSHILGLSDAGKIWSWSKAAIPGTQVQFLSIDLVESQNEDSSREQGYVRKVVAGWDRSSAYIVGKGIVVWVPSNNAEIQGQSDQSTGDGMLVLENWIVPGTSYVRPTKRGSDARGDPAHSTVGEVISWVVLERYVLFATHTGGLYASEIPTSAEELSTNALRINGRLDLSLPENANEHIIDVQGSFRSFAIFKRSGAVLLGDQNCIHARAGNPRDDWNGQPLSPDAAGFRKIPALQNSGVLALAFGDWHKHALHSDGTVSSYGNEPGRCGALGLGDEDTQIVRGLQRTAQNRDEMLTDECFTTGRRVWFEPEKKAWLDWLRKGGTTEEGRHECEERRDMMGRREVRSEVSEWFEERLRRWEVDAPGQTAPSVNQESHVDDDGLPAYFALNVAAAGWHSGALVLINEEKARKTMECYRAKEKIAEQAPPLSVFGIAQSLFSSFIGAAKETVEQDWIWEQEGETFPRLRLKDGEILPGEAEIVELPDHLRNWQEVELVDL